jgi:hypothetical protein
VVAALHLAGAGNQRQAAGIGKADLALALADPDF